MATLEELEERLRSTEATLLALFGAVTADLILFQAAVSALRDEGVLTLQIVDRMANDARARLKAYDSPALTPNMVTHIAKQLDSLVERLRAAVPSDPSEPPPKNKKRGDGEGSGNGHG